MDEMEFRATLTPEELERRAFIVPFKVYDPAVLERLYRASQEYAKTYDELINAAIVSFLDNVDTVQLLRLPIRAASPQCSQTGL
jgi:hypothetical protein